MSDTATLTRGSTETNAAVGAWTNFSALSSNANAVFEAAMKGLTGVSYTPFMVATQLVAGTNYCFICLATTVVPSSPQSAKMVYIYAPLPGQGNPHITQITSINP